MQNRLISFPLSTDVYQRRIRSCEVTHSPEKEILALAVHPSVAPSRDLAGTVEEKGRPAYRLSAELRDLLDWVSLCSGDVADRSVFRNSASARH